MDFHIEPQSASGEADLVAPELVLDAKVFDGERRGLTYIVHGVNQLHTYAQDFNQTVGYLVVFKTCPETLHFAVPSADDLVPHVTAAGKTLYLLTIDICEHQASASKRGPLKTISIDEATLVRAATETPVTAESEVEYRCARTSNPPSSDEHAPADTSRCSLPQFGWASSPLR